MLQTLRIYNVLLIFLKAADHPHSWDKSCTGILHRSIEILKDNVPVSNDYLTVTDIFNVLFCTDSNVYARIWSFSNFLVYEKGSCDYESKGYCIKF